MGVGIAIARENVDNHVVATIPEKAARIQAILTKISESGTLGNLSDLKVRPATEQEILGVHSENYFRSLSRSCELNQDGIIYDDLKLPADQRSRSLASVIAKHEVSDEEVLQLINQVRMNSHGDVPIVSSTFQAALISAGTVLSAIEAIANGGPKRVFCLTRPPGHHAEYDSAMGFCLFNNVGVGAQALLDNYGAKRVLIFDFDVHHGNASQHQFYHDPRVLVVNIHQDPTSYYPVICGYANERGVDAGLGYNLNIPLRPGSASREYGEAFDKAFIEIEKYKPEWCLVSAGFDAHRADGISAMKLSSDDYKVFAKRLAGIADTHSNGRLISVLEGGYHLGALASSVDAYLMGLLAA